MEYKLNEKIRKNIENLGYKNFTEIQDKVIPAALSGKDIIGKSQTGTGKTAAFLLPIIEKIKKGERSQAIILAPTRELALQIKEEADKISEGLYLSICPIYGGEGIEKQINFLKNKKPEIIVGTPGRIIDHLKRKNLNFSNLRFFVLDEVDEMVNRGFIDDIRIICKEAKNESPDVQMLLFSATISKETESILNEFLKSNKVFISSSDNSKVGELISQYYMPIDEKTNRMQGLIDIIYFQDPQLAIIFASTKRLVDKISEELTNQNFTVEKIHSDLSQKQRTDVYNKLKAKKVRFLVATDIAARGIDVEGVTHVYNYDCPQDLQFYVHRIGRTGRAGSKGESLIIMKKWERNQLFHMERITGNKIYPIYKPSEEQLEEIIKEKTVEKLENLMENSKNVEFSNKLIMDNILKKYSPEEVLRTLVNIISIKRTKVRNVDEGFSPKRKYYEKPFNFKNDKKKWFKSRKY